MTGTNHALTGALIASVVSNPALFVPLAVASHFVMDALPHFGEKHGQRKRLSKAVWAIDFIFLLCGFVYLFVSGSWQLMLGAFAAISPDLAWIYRFAVIERWGSLVPTKTNFINTWHASIQKYERRWGLIVELLWLVALVSIHVRFTL